MAFVPEADFPDFSTLITSLNTAQLSAKHPALYQTIRDFILKVQETRDLTKAKLEATAASIRNIPTPTVITPDVPVVIPGSFTVTAVGPINNLSFNNAPLILMNNASLATLQGLAAGTAGQEVTIISIGAGRVDLAHENAGSFPVNRLHNFVTVGNTPLVQGVGVATYKYEGVWRLTDHVQGASITPPFNAGDFGTSGGLVWTVDAADLRTFSYLLEGRKLTIFLSIDDTALSVIAGIELLILIPGGFISAKSIGMPINLIATNLVNPAIHEMGLIIAQPGDNTMHILRNRFIAFPVNLTMQPLFIFGQISFEVL